MILPSSLLTLNTNYYSAAGLRLKGQAEPLHIWNAAGKEIIRDNYKQLVLDSAEPIFYVTLGTEKFRSN